MGVVEFAGHHGDLVVLGVKARQNAADKAGVAVADGCRGHIGQVKGIGAHGENKLLVRELCGHGGNGLSELAALADDDLISLLGELAEHLHLLVLGDVLLVSGLDSQLVLGFHHTLICKLVESLVRDQAGQDHSHAVVPFGRAAFGLSSPVSGGGRRAAAVGGFGGAGG